MFLQEDPKQRQNTQDIPMRGHSKHVEYYKDGDTPVLPPGLAHEHQAHIIMLVLIAISMALTRKVGKGEGRERGSGLW